MRPLWQRVVALTAAYAIALAGLVASFGVARAAAAMAAAPNVIICHTAVAGDEAPAPASDQDTHCADNCCIGCLSLLSELPPAPAGAIAAPQSASHQVVPLQSVVVTGDPHKKSHQSRAPPLPA
jgi:hypothetical protein